MSGILFADCDTRYASVLRHRFEMGGISFVCHTNASDVVPYAKTLKPDVIVCSLRIDHADGFEVMKDIREDAQLGVVPCVVLSDLADAFDIRRCRALGCVAYFIKRHTKPEQFFAYLRHSGYLSVH